MRFRIEADPVGLSVLRDIPGPRLAVLEGLNGIGKTLAIRLLQLCTGTFPYPPDSAAWKSLGASLGEITVTAVDLPGVKEVKWHADSRRWKDDTSPAQLLNIFDSITVDGRQVSIEEIRKLLVVYRIGGDETLIETLAQQADAFGSVIRRWRRRYADEESGPLARLESAVSAAAKALGERSAEDWEELRAASVAADKALQKADLDAKQLETRKSRLLEAAELTVQIEAVRDAAPGLKARLKDADERIGVATAQRDHLQGELSKIAAEVAVAGPAGVELKRAQNTVAKNRGHLADAVQEAVSIAATLECGIDAGVVEKKIEALAHQVTALKAEQNELDSAPAMREVLQEVADDLTRAEGRGFGDQIAVEDADSGLQLTVAQTKTGVLTRRVSLEGKPPPPEARAVADHLARATGALVRARQLLSAVENVQKFQRLVQTNEERVATALGAASPDALLRMESLDEQRRATDRVLLDLTAERASLAHQFSALGAGKSPQDLSQTLAEILTAEEVGAADLENALALAESNHREGQGEAVNAQKRSAELHRDIVRAEADIREAAHRFATDDAVEWARKLFPGAVTPGADILDVLSYLDEIRSILASVTERLGRLRDQIGAVEAALDDISAHLRQSGPVHHPGQSSSAPARYRVEIDAWLGARFARWFNQGVRPQLLPQADADVVVDVANRQLVWREAGRRLSRPLEAFSSGEQAFAYTRARLAVLEDAASSPANRLIVLDEFGAFIAHDRLAGLLSDLKQRSKNFPADHVLVILPLSQDYRVLAQSAVGDQQETYLGWAREVTDRGYAVRPLD
jgi:hypothetical protein